MAEFTAGPWLRIDTADYAEIHAAFHPSSQAVALVAKPGDANLIAAAPDLFNACKEWIDWLTVADWRDDAAAYEARVLSDMRAAVTRAAGEQS